MLMEGLLLFFVYLVLPMKLCLLHSHQIVESHVLHAQFSFVIVREQEPKNESFVQPSPQKMFDA